VDSPIPSDVNGLSNLMVAGAIVVSAVLASIVALLAIAHNRRISRKKSAYDIIIRTMSHDIRRAETVFLKRSERRKWTGIIKPTNAKDRRDKQDIIYYLNHYEFMCVAIQQNIVDESVLKDIIGDKMVKTYSSGRALISQIRDEDGDDEFYEHFERVARRWRDYPKGKRRGILRTLFGEVIKT